MGSTRPLITSVKGIPPFVAVVGGFRAICRSNVEVETHRFLTVA